MTCRIWATRRPVVFDVVVRLLRALFPRVTYVRNITDVDDKINAARRRAGEPIAAVTARTRPTSTPTWRRSAICRPTWSRARPSTSPR